MAISSSASGLRPGVCTSTTRPTNPYTGQIIFQTDTGTMHNWDGAAWQFLAPTQQPNLLYNGAMQVAQRSSNVPSITTSNYYTADRWQIQGSAGFGTWTQSIDTDAPTGSGFRRSLRMLCTTAKTPLDAASLCMIRQPLEGQDVQAIRKGTSSAQQLTVSFWVKSNVTGTYVFALFDNDNNRVCARTYSVSASGTWEFKTITFPADTTGAFDNDNGASLYAVFHLLAGTQYSSGTLQTTWGTFVDANYAVGQVNVAAATNNYWQVTGVQLNVGAVAAPFEFKSFGQELQLCQRYYYRMTSQGSAYNRFAVGQADTTTVAEAMTFFPVTMRTSPTALEQSGTASHYGALNAAGNLVGCNAVPTFNNANIYCASTTYTVASGLVAGNASQLLANNTTSAYLGWSAEL